jgi:hypothetical protein
MKDDRRGIGIRGGGFFQDPGQEKVRNIQIVGDALFV